MSTTHTNIHNIPQPFLDAIMFSDFSPIGTMTLHKLIDAPQTSHLRKHNNMEEDISEKAWTMLNKALLQVIENGDNNHRHRRAFSTTIQALVAQQNEVLEDTPETQQHKTALGEIIAALDQISTESFPADKDRYLIRQSYGVQFEESYTCFKGTDKEFSSKEKQTIFDTIPLYDKETRTLYYVKICNTFHATKSDLRNNWIREANIQAYILGINGFPVEKIEATMLFKDWTSGRIGQGNDYPKSQMESMQLPVHREEDIEKVIRIQLRRHLKAINGDVPECNDAERWAEKTTWAVKRPNVKNPARILLTEKEATDYLAANRVKLADGYIEKRPGKSKRCESYCPVRDVCGQWKALREKMLPEPVTE